MSAQTCQRQNYKFRFPTLTIKVVALGSQFSFDYAFEKGEARHNHDRQNEERQEEHPVPFQREEVFFDKHFYVATVEARRHRVVLTHYF